MEIKNLLREGVVITFADNQESNTPHPAKYTDDFIPIFAEQVLKYKKDNKPAIILDPFGGTGKLGLIKKHLPESIVITNEIEKEWADQSYSNGVDFALVGDSTDLPFSDESLPFIITSPTYGNRMADSHEAKDGSRRNTYTHKLGRRLTDNNSGKMQWGKSYRDLHRSVYKECYRTLEFGGIMIINMKDHIRSGERIHVTDWHKRELMSLGFTHLETIEVEVTGNGFGANAHLRVPYESLIVFKKEELT